MSNLRPPTGAQAEAEAAVRGFRDHLGPFVIAAEQTRMPMVFTDAKAVGNPIVFANESFLKLIGCEREEVLGKPVTAFAPPLDDASLAAIDGQDHHHSPCGPEFSYCRNDGSVFYATVFVSSVRNTNGDIVQHFASFVDQTELMGQHAKARMLIDELNHRVKNTLATVQSIVAQSFRTNADPASTEEAIRSRLFALSRSQDLLTHENSGSANLGDVIGKALEPFTKDSEGRVVLTGQDLRISSKATLALGIAFHELATNAAKYGAFSNGTGHVSVDLIVTQTAEGERLSITWREHGGPPVTPPSQRGFGSRVIERGLAHGLHAEVDLSFAADGVICSMNMPTPRVLLG